MRHRYQKTILIYRIKKKTKNTESKNKYLLNQKKHIRFAMKSLGIRSRVGGRSSGPAGPPGPLVRWSPGPLVLWSAGPLVLPPNLHSKAHKVLHLPRNLHFKVHKKGPAPATKICTPRPIKSCAYHWPPILHFNIHKVLHLPRNVHCKVHKVLHLPRSTTTTTTILLLLVRLLLLLLLLFGIFFLLH